MKHRKDGRPGTMRQFADMLGLSRWTVSMALREDSRVKLATRLRVQRLARELGYRPNSAARALVQREIPAIGLVFAASFPHEPAHGWLRQYSVILAAIGNELEKRSRALMLATPYATLGRDEVGPQLPLILRESHVSGLIVVGNIWPELRDEIRKVGLPCVTTDAQPLEDVAAVYADEAKGAELAVDHLVKLGHSRIAFINSARRSLFRSVQRPLGYLRAMTQHRLLPVPGWDEHHELSDMLKKLMQFDDPPTGLLCYDDEDAVHACRWLRDRRLAVPEKVSVVGLDDIEAGEFCIPTITRVTKPFDKMGAQAVQLLEELLEGKADRPRHVQFTPSLLVAQSSGPCPA